MTAEVECRKEKVQLMLWMSVKADPEGRIDDVCRLLEESCQVDKIYYLYTYGKKNKDETVKKVAEEMQSKYPEMEAIPVDIGDANDHNEVYEGVKSLLKIRLQEFNNLRICATGGTAAMHAVWIVLYAVGYYPSNTGLFRISNQKIDPINFKLDTYYSVIRETEKKERIDNLFDVPDSESGRKVYDDILRYAKVPNAPLLILGERGTGKTHAVRNWIKTVKFGSAKDKVPFVHFACGNFDKNMDSYLFGYVEGSFTGAKKGGAVGLIEQARNGILFLDEIQDVSKEVQRKLIKILENKEYTKYGATDGDPIPIDFNLVCATNVSEEMLREKLDLDFYDRICMYKVSMPPLRERREDLLLIWRDVWKGVCKKTCNENLQNNPFIDVVLEKYFETSDLAGNYRSLQRIAYLKIAWGEDKSTEEILKMVENDDRLDRTSPDSSDEFFAQFENMRWNDAGASFKRQLVEYCEKKYGSLAEVEKKTHWEIKTMQNAKKKEVYC